MQCLENSLTCDVYYKLRESVGWSNFCEEQVINVLKNSAYDIVVYEGIEEIGMGRVIGDGMYYTIVDLVVKPEFQGMGIGTAIICKILDFITKTTPNKGRVSIQLIAEKGKEVFYEKQGFKKIPHENCGSGMRKIIYT